MGGCLYLCHPREKYLPGVGDSVRAGIKTAEAWDGWKIQRHEYDINNSLRAQTVEAQVIARPGPVLLLTPVQSTLVEELRMRLRGRVSVLMRDCFDEASLLNSMEEARNQYEAGDPQLAHNYVVALLVMRKLDRELRWAGNAKGYMWMDDIPKGRGIAEDLSSSVAHCINVLQQHDMLVWKTSQSSRKYALNPQRRAEIYEILRSRVFPDGLMKVLSRDQRTISARSLDVLIEYNTEPAR